MQKLNESPVTPDQIDSLGHLNVRYYIARMDLANRQLLESNGVSGDEHAFLRRVDTYNKLRFSDDMLGGRHFFWNLGKRWQKLQALDVAGSSQRGGKGDLQRLG